MSPKYLFIFVFAIVLSACSSRLALLRNHDEDDKVKTTIAGAVPFDHLTARQMTSYGNNQFQAPDYKFFTDLLNKNIEVYDLISDTIFIQAPKDEWIATYLQRAQKTSDLSQWNQDAIDYFLPHIWQDSVPEGFERYLYETFINNSIQEDDFLYEEILSRLFIILENDRMKSEANMSMFLNIKFNLAQYNHLTSLYGDNNAFATTYRHLRDIIDNYIPGKNVPNNKINTSIYFKSCNYLLDYREFIKRGFMSDKEAIALGQYVQSALTDTLIAKNLSDELRRKTIQSLASQELGILRNIYMPDTTHTYDHIRDSLQLVFIHKYDAHPELEERLSATEKRRLAIMRYRCDSISALQALEECEKTKVAITQSLNDDLSQLEFNSQISRILDCIYCIDVSEMSFEQKRQRVLKYRDEIFHLLTLLDEVQRMPNLINTLSNVATYQRLHKYLVTEERKEVLETLLFFSQPFTRAHSETVTSLALVILRGVIDYRPELLLGMRDYNTTEELQQHPERLISFFTDGSRYHDLGKTRMPDIIRNEYRKLTDHEFAIIKLHPELGLTYLQVDPSLMELHDIVLGHHRWYDGKGGYPAHFDNTKSPYRVLIDILTLADCIEAATARLGRNYRKNKTYDDVLKEFKMQAGTRYNPELVQLLEDHEDIANQLREISAKGWEDIYYNVFNKKPIE